MGFQTFTPINNSFDGRSVESKEKDFSFFEYNYCNKNSENNQINKNQHFSENNIFNVKKKLNLIILEKRPHPELVKEKNSPDISVKSENNFFIDPKDNSNNINGIKIDIKKNENNSNNKIQTVSKFQIKNINLYLI